MRHLIPALLITLAATLAGALPAAADDDPPARVGRLAHFENSLIFRVDRSDAGAPATLNWPISSGAVLESGARGRVEVWIGSTAFRIDGDTQLEFPVVDDQRIDLNLNGGSLAVSILDGDQFDDLVVATPDGQVRFHAPGRYRLDVFGDRSTLSVQAGQASFGTPARATPVGAGQKMTRWSDGGEQLAPDRDQDAFDRWVAARENATLAATTRRHVATAMTGYQDLDAWGDWQSVPDYGAVWYPRAVADDWAPYRYGRWAWIDPWGWTWIDQAPWGFAPFHYGRWAIIHGRWAWLPGRPVARPVYAPALVAWIGNPGWSVGFSFGSAPAVGWFPLGPREVYVPGHRHSPRYVRQININYVSNVTVIDRAARPGHQATYVNRQSPRAVTVVPARLLSEGRAITSREMRREAPRELDRVPLARSAPQADWVAPPARSGRPADEARRRDFPASRSPRDRDNDAPHTGDRGARPPVAAQPAEGERFRRPRQGEEIARPDSDPARQPMRQPGQAMPAPSAERDPGRDPRRDPPATPRPERAAPPPAAAPGLPEGGRPPAGATTGEAGGEANRDLNRESRRERFRQPPETAPQSVPDTRPAARPADAQPGPAPLRRDTPAVESRPTAMPERESRRDAPPAPERDMRRDGRPDFRQAPPDAGRDGGEARRERFRQPAETPPEARPVPRPVDIQPAPQPMRREAPPVEPRSEPRPMPAPALMPEREPRREMRPEPTRPEPMRSEPRPEMREAPRLERAMPQPPPQPMAPPAMPQRQEMPRPAPEVRMPAPVREAPPMAAPREAPRMETPRPAAPPEQRGERGGRGRHDEERPGR